MTALSINFQRPSAMPGRNNFKSKFYPHTFGDAGESNGGEARKALIVDDNLDLLELAAQLFTLLGFEVLTAGTGEAALEILKREPDIEVLFSDVVMPGISGMQLGEEAVALIPGVKVILVSGYPSLRAGVRGSVYEFAFLNKPYQLGEIARVLASE